jgi:uncharacterized protein (TIGR03435 family)
VVLKSKPKELKPFDPAEVVPSRALKFSPYTAKLVPGPPPNAFFDTSMQALAYFLTHSSGPPVFDATGLPGTYNFELAHDVARPATANDPGSPRRDYIEDLGLGFRATSRNMPTLVVDHYEKPSPN